MEISTFTSDFENLPMSIQKQVVEYAEFLISKTKSNKKTRKTESQFTFSRENGLNELKDEYTSVECNTR
ncbi:MAG: DUF2281 domain-containing protein [Mariniphaga sp.]